MGFDVSGLPAYTDETRMKLLVKTLYTSPTAAKIKAANGIIPGIKSAQALPMVESVLSPQAAGCGWQTSGSTAISRRVLTVTGVKFAEELCPEDLEPKFLQNGLDAGAPESLGIFAKQIGEEKAENIMEFNELTNWTGSTGNVGEWDGYKTILDTLGFDGLGDPVRGNPVSGAITTMTVSNIDDCILRLWNNIPDRVRAKNDNVVWMGLDQFDNAIQNLVAQNLYNYPATATTDFEFVWPGTRLKLIGVPGLSGTDVLISGRMKNFYMGTDMLNEWEKYKLWWDESDQIVKWLVQYKFGVQVAFPGEITYFKLP